jgi:hypothetical protein
LSPELSLERAPVAQTPHETIINNKNTKTGTHSQLCAPGHLYIYVYRRL